MPRASQILSPKLLLPLAALLTTLPLLLHGVSCGHDLGFHVQNWLDAAGQLRHGHYPRWAVTPAWNAGEPRFLFYPPLSWLFGALLTLLLPAAATPIAYVFLTFTAAGFAMHRFARAFATPNAALLAAVLYLANPYMLFNAFERSALAELLASVWIPLLLLAILLPRPTIRGIAIPFALLWLTNAPAAVMGSYTFALLATMRIVFTLSRRTSNLSSRPERPTSNLSSRPERSAVERPAVGAASPPYSPLPSPLSPASLIRTSLAGTALGLALPAFYLIPAAYQRRFVQVAMAIIPNMRFQDNFLFTHTADTPHNDVNDTASYLTLSLLATAILTLTAVFLARRKAGVPYLDSKMGAGENTRWATLPTTLALLTAVITLLLLPLSTPIWLHLPEFAFLQFPWRLNTILSAIAASAIAVLVTRLTPKSQGGPFMRSLWRMSGVATLLAVITIPLALTFLCYNLYAQGCDIYARPAAMDTFFRTHHGVAPTDEYTPNNADNDLLRTDNPAYWLAPLADPNAPAPNTVPTPNELNPTANTDNYTPPAEETLSTPVPHHLIVTLPQPAILVLHLRDYPAWRITRNATELPAHRQRDDGLVALSLPAGASTIDIAWHTGPDQILGLILSILALLILIAPSLTSSRKKAQSQPSSKLKAERNP